MDLKNIIWKSRKDARAKIRDLILAEMQTAKVHHWCASLFYIIL